MSSLTAPLTRRDLGAVVILCVVTVTFYAFYWIPKLGEDVNRVLGRWKYRFGVMLLLGIVTLGLALSIFEILFAYDLQKNERYSRLARARRNLGGTVLALNVTALLVSIVSAGLGILLGVALGIWATWLVQEAINEIVLAEPDGALLQER